MVPRMTIIANRNAGRGDTAGCPFSSFGAVQGIPYDLRSPNSSEEMRQICDKMEPTSCRGLFFVGGDGTFNQALSSIAGRGIPVGVIPAGTANDLAGELGVSGRTQQLQDLIDNDSISHMDLIRVNGALYATVGGIGIGAVLTEEMNRRRQKSRLFRWLLRRTGALIYTLLAIKTILFHRNLVRDVLVRSKEFNGKVRTAALFVCNQRRLGGSFVLAADARNNDGRFEVVILRQTCLLGLLRALFQIWNGKLPKNAIEFSSENVLIQDGEGRELAAFGDGERVTHGKNLEFSIFPNALAIYRPGFKTGK